MLPVPRREEVHMLEAKELGWALRAAGRVLSDKALDSKISAERHSQEGESYSLEAARHAASEERILRSIAEALQAAARKLGVYEED
jgi:hypothetical protein